MASAFPVSSFPVRAVFFDLETISDSLSFHFSSGSKRVRSAKAPSSMMETSRPRIALGMLVSLGMSSSILKSSFSAVLAGQCCA